MKIFLALKIKKSIPEKLAFVKTKFLIFVKSDLLDLTKFVF